MKTAKIGPVKIGGAPRVVGSVTSMRAAARLPALRERAFDVAEFRVDLMGGAVEEILRLAIASEKAGLPVLWTVRSAAEGGAWTTDEESRLEVYRQALSKVSAVDVEMCSSIFPEVVRLARRARKTVVASFHDFHETPPLSALRELIRMARSMGALIVKVATHLQQPDDAIVLYELLRERRLGPVCAIGMGAWGAATRVGLPCAGSCLAYGYVDRSAAPGQFSCRELRRLLNRWYPNPA